MPRNFLCLALGQATKRVFGWGARRLEMGTQKKSEERRARQELMDELRRLAKWKNNDVVKLAFLDGEEADKVDALDLSGVVELRRNANGTFEAKFVDEVRVLAMLREVLDEGHGGALEDFLDGLYRDKDGDGA